MKRGWFYFVFLVLFISLVFALEEPTTGIEGEDKEKIEDAIDKIPIDEDTGEFDLEKFNESRTKAEERIEKINTYVGPITKALWGAELTLSWIFIFSFIVWILLIELLVMPASEIFNVNILGSLFVSAIIASLAMQGFGEDLVLWMESLATQWWIGVTVLFVAGLFAVIYSIIMRGLGDKADAMREESDKLNTGKDRAILHAEVEGIEKGLKEESKKSSHYKPKMRRGGTNSRRGRFVKKDSVDRYARRYGDDATKKRFGN